MEYIHSKFMGFLVNNKFLEVCYNIIYQLILDFLTPHSSFIDLRPRIF
jgi:hypothetical protein